MFRLIFLVAFVATASVGNIGSQCFNNASDLPLSFEVEGCSATSCALHQLEDAVINVKFNAPRDTKSLTSRLTVYILSLPIPLHLGGSSVVCDALTKASCPVKEGQELEYTLKLPVEPFYPVGVTVTVEVQVVDDAGSPAFCARFPIQIAPPRN